MENMKNIVPQNEVTLQTKQTIEENKKMPKNDYLKHIKKIKKLRDEKEVGVQ